MTNQNSCTQIRIITRLTALGCITSMLLCYKLWFGDRTFPEVPVFDFLSFPYLLDTILSGLSIILLICILLLRFPQKFIIGFVIVAALLGLMDINRFQPWFYQYLLMFFLLCFFNFRCDDTRKQQAIVTTFKLMIAAIYFWSGLQKLNPHFLTDTFPWLMEPITNHLPEANINSFKILGYAFPLIEIFTGICLLINGLQRPAIILASLMHLFILLVLSPFGHNYNYVVWPWNIVMIGLNFVLFFNESSLGLTDLRNAISYHGPKIVVILFVMMPLFNFFNSWSSYLSHNLYSGNTDNGVVCISDSVKNKLPANISKYAVADGNQFQINIKYWCMQELGVPAFPEKRNFEKITNYFYAYTNDPSQIFLYYTPKLRFNEK
jgi:uncharacterized membrane protein YphA (DoxX/SURF4 family)